MPTLSVREFLDVFAGLQTEQPNRGLSAAEPFAEEDKHDGEDHRPSEAILQTLCERALRFWHQCLPQFCESSSRRRQLGEVKTASKCADTFLVQ